MQISVVIPLFNEQDSLEELHSELLASAEKAGFELEVVFVDDGSNDSSWTVIETICQNHTKTKGIQFRRNFGKAAAIKAGVAHASHDIIVTIDADLQDDPGELPKLVEQINEGWDVVSGWKIDRKDPISKRFPSKILIGWSV